MRTRPVITVALVGACAAAVAGTYFGKRLWATAARSQAAEQPQNVEAFTFVVDHPPVIWRDTSDVVSFEVPLVNRTTDVVRFTGFACDCGCTSASLAREELQPGESTTVRMAVNLSGREGSQRFACHWGDDLGRRWSAESRVTVYRPAQFDPGVLRLGKVSTGDAISRQVHYDEYAATAGDFPPVPSFSISSLHRDSVRLGVNPPAFEHLGGGLVRRRTPIDVGFAVANRGGYAEMFLTPSMAPSGQPLPSLRIDWSARETVEVSPARLALTFSAKGADRRTQVVRIRPLDGRTLVIGRITTTEPGIQGRLAAAPPSPAGAADIEVTVTLAEGKRVLAGEVVLQLSQSKADEVRIPVTAIRVGSD